MGSLSLYVLSELLLGIGSGSGGCAAGMLVARSRGAFCSGAGECWSHRVVEILNVAGKRWKLGIEQRSGIETK